jgi:hypothetical protein
MGKALKEKIIDAKNCVEEAIYMLYKLSNDLSTPIYTSIYTSTSISKEQLLKDIQLRLSVLSIKLNDCHRILKEVVYAK